MDACKRRDEKRMTDRQQQTKYTDTTVRKRGGGIKREYLFPRVIVRKKGERERQRREKRGKYGYGKVNFTHLGLLLLQ
jgi:hypothetical protein